MSLDLSVHLRLRIYLHLIILFFVLGRAINSQTVSPNPLLLTLVTRFFYHIIHACTAQYMLNVKS